MAEAEKKEDRDTLVPLPVKVALGFIAAAVLLWVGSVALVFSVGHAITWPIVVLLVVHLVSVMRARRQKRRHSIADTVRPLIAGARANLRSAALGAAVGAGVFVALDVVSGGGVPGSSAAWLKTATDVAGAGLVGALVVVLALTGRGQVASAARGVEVASRGGELG